MEQYGTYSNSDYSISVKENVPGKPSGLKVSKTSKTSITLTWKAAADGVKYQVYHSTKKDSGYKLIATVSGTSYTNSKLSANTTYYYKIRAVNGDGYTGAYSGVLTAKTKK